MTIIEANYKLFSKDSEAYEKDQAALSALRYIWDNNGRLPNGEQVSLEQTFQTDTQHMQDNGMGDQPMLTQRVITEFANEAVEPTPLLKDLFVEISVPQPGAQITIPSWGGMHAGDVSAGGEYPSRSMELGGYIIADVGKVGIRVPISDEMIKNSSFDLIAMHTRAAAAAVIRRKEEKLATAMLDKGKTIIDNGSTSFKSSTGRSAAGQFNGTLTLDDIAYVHERMTNDGYQPDTLIMHPSAWRLLCMESLKDLFDLRRGANWTADQNPVYRGTNISRKATGVTGRFPTDWNIIVTPYMPYNPTNSVTVESETNQYWPLTDIIICDSNAVGTILKSSDGIETEEFRDPSRDIQNLKLRELYGIAIVEDGEGINVLKNITVGRGVDLWENSFALTTPGGGNLVTVDRIYSGVAFTGNA
jgi:hypothetical protein